MIVRDSGRQLARACAVRNFRATVVRIGVAVMAFRKPLTMACGESPACGGGGLVTGPSTDVP
jgi:hypothetical protein